MWRFFNALCMLSVVALLSLHGGPARSLPEQPLWRSELDRMECAKLDRGVLGVSVRPLPVPATAGVFSGWTPPAEIEARAGAGALIWRPPGEIASAPATVDFGAVGATAKPASSWAPPAEIATKNVSSAFAERPRVWLPPAEIAADHSDALGLAIGATGDAPAAHWARPREIAAEAAAVEHRSAFTGDARGWLPPAEIAPPQAAIDYVVTGLVAPHVSAQDPRSDWALPAEIAERLPTPRSVSVARSAPVWRLPEEIATPRIALK